MRLGGLATLIGPASLEDHDRLLALLDGREEPRRVLDSLDVEGDHLRVLVRRKEIDQVGLVDVDPVSHAHEGREAELLLGGPVDQGGSDGPALRRDGHGPFSGDERPGRAKAVVGVVDPLTVRPDDADAAPQCVSRHLLLEAGSLSSRLGETPGDDDGRPDFPLAELENRLGDGSRRDDDDSQVGAGRNLPHRFHRRNPEDCLFLRIHGDDRPCEAGVEDVLQDLVAELSGLCGGADDGKTVRAEEGLQGIAHVAPRRSCFLKSIAAFRRSLLPARRYLRAPLRQRRGTS